MRKAVLQTLLYSLMLGLAACGGASSPTPTPSAPGLAPLSMYFSTTSLYALTASDGSVRWNVKGGQYPILENGIVYANYFQGYDSGVAAFNASDGGLRWFYRASASVFVMGVVNGVVYAVINDMQQKYGSIYALRDGKVLWHTDDPRLVYGYLVADGIAYASLPINPSASVFGLAAFDTKNGNLLWRFQPENGQVQSPQASDGQVYVTVLKADQPVLSYLAVLNASDGSVRWRYPQTGYASFKELAEGNGLVYLTSLDDGMLYALDTSDGSVKWRSKNGGGNDTTFALLKDDMFYVGLGDGSFYALNASDGSPKWQTRIGGKGLWATVPQAAADGSVYVSRSQSGLSVLNANDGSVRWAKADIQDPMWTVAPIEGVAYVFTSDTVANRSTFYAFDMSTGTQRWKYQTTETLMPAIG